jgi:hypothetical protein
MRLAEAAGTKPLSKAQLRDQAAGLPVAVPVPLAVQDSGGGVPVPLARVHALEEALMHQVRKTPSWPRSWANCSLLSLYSHWNAWANLDILGQPNTFLAPGAAQLKAPARVTARARATAR